MINQTTLLFLTCMLATVNLYAMEDKDRNYNPPPPLPTYNPPVRPDINGIRGTYPLNPDTNIHGRVTWDGGVSVGIHRRFGSTSSHSNDGCSIL